MGRVPIIMSVRGSRPNPSLYPNAAAAFDELRTVEPHARILADLVVSIIMEYEHGEDMTEVEGVTIEQYRAVATDIVWTYSAMEG
jgi:hypothetical protein